MASSRWPFHARIDSRCSPDGTWTSDQVGGGSNPSGRATFPKGCLRPIRAGAADASCPEWRRWRHSMRQMPGPSASSVRCSPRRDAKSLPTARAGSIGLALVL